MFVNTEIGGIKMKEVIKRSAAAVSAFLICLGMNGTLLSARTSKTYAAASASRVRVDINRNDGRSALWSPYAENWNFTGDAYKLNGITFKLSSGGSVGSGIDCTNNKKLQKYDGSTPYLTADGVRVKDGDKGGIIKLEISGLSAGKHSFTGWHSCLDGVTASTLKLTVNGKTAMSGIK